MKLLDTIMDFCTDHAPEILTYGGIALGGLAAVGACFATVKAIDALEDFKETMDTIHEANDLAEELATEQGKPEAREKYSVEDYKKDVRKSYLQLALKMAKIYGPWVLMGVLAALSEIKGNNIYRQRTLALSAEVALLKTTISKIYERTSKKYGKEAADAIVYGVEKKEIEEKVVDENGNETTVKKEIEVSHLDGCSPYAIYFNDCDFYRGDNDQDVWFIHNIEERCRLKYNAKGIAYLSLKEVYENLGYDLSKDDEHTKYLRMACMRVGWKKTCKNSDNNDLIFKVIRTYRERPDGELEPAIIVDFNVDGDIFKMCEEDFWKEAAIEVKEAV